MILLQEIASDTLNRAPDAPLWLWGISEVLVTVIVFVGVYFIFKPLIKKGKED